MDLTAELKEWIQIFLKSRDILEKSIVGFEDSNGDFVVHKSSGDVVFLIRPELVDVSDVVQKVSGSAGLVVLNTRKNIDVIISNWGALAKLSGLCIYFVNPRENEKWMLYPFTHDRITEKPALRRGLLSLFSTVPAV